MVAALVALAAMGCAGTRQAPAAVIGVPEGTSTSTAGPRILTPSTVTRTALPLPPADLFVEGAADQRVRAEPRGGSGMIPADGASPPAAIPFVTGEPVPDDLVFILVAGSDARPREDLFRTRADSIHVVAVNPATGEGTLLGVPRDSWVEIPGHGRDKINNALALGGPNLLAATVRRLTGLPVDYYVLTGFPGLTRMVDDLGGVDVMVDRRMNDRVSGARFERGWHRMSGAEALAFTRNRNDVANGDFSRSENQGVLMLAALAKMRAEVGDDAGVARWIGVLLNYVRLDIPRDRLPALGALARRLDPAGLRNVVAPGRIGSTRGQSVVYLTTAAARMFEDLRADAVIGGPRAAPPAETATTTTTGPGAASATTATTGSAGSTTTTADSTTSTTEPAEQSTTTSTSDPPGFFDDPNEQPFG
ncbi:MAG: LCP family protein [Actinomycetota bacterium]|nr:LCP family protein [Actinomycetota bacterium]